MSGAMAYDSSSVVWEMNFHGSYGDPKYYPALIYKCAKVSSHVVRDNIAFVIDSDSYSKIDIDHVGVGPNHVSTDPNLHQLYVGFDHSGLQGRRKLDLPESAYVQPNRYVSPNQQLGQKENLRLEADIRATSTCGQGIEAHTVSSDDDTPLIETSVNGRLTHRKLGHISGYGYLNPILHIQQPGGFMQLAELREPDSGWCRLLFSIVMGEPEQQFHIVTQGYLPGRNPHTVAVVQDGDSRTNDSYFEFWFQNTKKIGHFPIGRAAFPFIKDSETTIHIGCWPRDEESLFFHGDIFSIKCDPHGLCPC